MKPWIQAIAAVASSVIFFGVLLFVATITVESQQLSARRR